MVKKSKKTISSIIKPYDDPKSLKPDNPEELVQFLTREYLNDVMSGILGTEEKANLVGEVQEIMKDLPLASHLITPRTGYTHHGLYVGNGRVIHYSGFARGFQGGPINEVSLSEFHDGKGYRIEPHHNSPFTPEEVVARARSRMTEEKYSLVANNCEHFVNWCIDNYHSSWQVNNVVATAAGKVPVGGAAIVNIAQASIRCSDAFRAFIRGDITKEKLFEESAQAIGTTATTFYYGVAAQTLMPYAPGVGFAIGTAVGLVVGSTLQRAGLLTLGESGAVQVARDRRKKIEALCESNTQAIRQARQAMNQFLDEYFEGRREVFDEAFGQLDMALQDNNSSDFTSALEMISKQFGDVAIQFGTREDFDQFMARDESFKF